MFCTRWAAVLCVTKRLSHQDHLLKHQFTPPVTGSPRKPTSPGGSCTARVQTLRAKPVTAIIRGQQEAVKPHEINVKRGVLASGFLLHPRGCDRQVCESTQAAEHSLHAVRTDNCHLSFPRVNMGGQDQGHLHQNPAPHGSVRLGAECQRNLSSEHFEAMQQEGMYNISCSAFQPPAPIKPL